MAADRTGIYKHGAGWRAVVSMGSGRPALMQHFPRDTPVTEMQRWRAKVARARAPRRERLYKGSFEGDVTRYLETVTALVTLSDRKRELQHWIDVFGRRRRDTITSAEIRSVRDRWLIVARADDDKRPLAPGTVNKRLRALSNLYRVLDGPQAYNPVRDVPEAREPEPEPRALDYATIERVLAALPDSGRAGKGQERPAVSRTKIRLHCLAYCQITPKQLSALSRGDLDLERSRLRLPARKKGKGSRAVWTPLLPQAVEAFRDFDRHNCYGTFSQSSLRQSFKRACKRVGVIGARPYDLRHSFATFAYEATNSLEAVGRLMQHRSPKTTRRYALGAEQSVLAETGQSVVRAFGKRHG